MTFACIKNCIKDIKESENKTLGISFSFILFFSPVTMLWLCSGQIQAYKPLGYGLEKIMFQHRLSQIEVMQCECDLSHFMEMLKWNNP